MFQPIISNYSASKYPRDFWIFLQVASHGLKISCPEQTSFLSLQYGFFPTVSVCYFEDLLNSVQAIIN